MTSRLIIIGIIIFYVFLCLWTHRDDEKHRMKLGPEENMIGAHATNEPTGITNVLISRKKSEDKK